MLDDSVWHLRSAKKILDRYSIQMCSIYHPVYTWFYAHLSNNCVSSCNQDNYRELLKSFGKLDSVFARRLHGRLQDSERPDSGGVFIGMSADVENDLIECIDAVIAD
jgi:hypothetical protein